MVYRPMGASALGKTVPYLGKMEDCKAFYSGGIDYCLGYETSCPDGEKCCPSSTWYNLVYAEKRGKSSLRRQNEEKLRYGIGLLVAPTEAGFPTGIEQFAWDSGGLAVQPGLLDELSKAITNFDAAFPGARFTFKDKRKKTDRCQKDGWYSGYSLRAHWPTSRIQAVEALSGYTFSPAEVQQLQRGGIAAPGEFSATAAKMLPKQIRPLEAPPAVAELFQRVANIVNSCPGCRFDDYRDTMPTFGQLVSVGGVRGSQAVVAGPWLQSFISGLQAKKTVPAWIPSFPGKFRPPAGVRFPKLPPFEPPHDPGIKPGPGAAPSTVMLVGGALVAGVAGYALLRRLG